MDSYNLSNLPPYSGFADSGECNPCLTDEQNTRVTFSGRSATVSTPEQAERQQLLSSGGEQTSEQKPLAKFDTSLSLNIHDPLIVDGPVVDKPEGPFAALAAYQPLSFNEAGQSLDSNLSLSGDINVSKAVLAEPEQSQGEFDAAGFIIPESAISDTFSGKCSRKRRASEPRSLIQESIDRYAHDSSLCRSKRLAVKRQKLDSKETELLAPPREMVTRSGSADMPKTPATSPNYIGRSMDKSLWDRVKKETDKWVVQPKDSGEPFACGYPDCGHTFDKIGNLKTHIFNHIHISKYKCTHPECGDDTYFRHITDLRRHVYKWHTDERPYSCKLCDNSFRRLDHYKRHLLRLHKVKL